MLKYITILTLILTLAPIQSLGANAVVLMYHRLDDKNSSMSLNPASFDEEMKYLHDNGYHVISSMDLVNAIQHKTDLPSKSIVITFDDGWKNQTLAMETLHKYHFPAQFALITQYITDKYAGYLSKQDIDKYEDDGFIFVNHSRTHFVKDYLHNPNEDIEISTKQLKEITPLMIPIYVYPYGLQSHDLTIAIQKAGYIAAFGTDGISVNTHTANIYNINRFGITNEVSMDEFIKIVQNSN